MSTVSSTLFSELLDSSVTPYSLGGMGDRRVQAAENPS